MTFRDKMLQAFHRLELTEEEWEAIGRVSTEPMSLLFIASTECVDSLWVMVNEYVAMYPNEKGVEKFLEYKDQELDMPDKVQGYRHGSLSVCSTINGIMTWESKLDPSLYCIYEEKVQCMFFINNVFRMYRKITGEHFVKGQGVPMTIAILRLARLWTSESAWQWKRNKYAESLGENANTEKTPPGAGDLSSLEISENEVSEAVEENMPEGTDSDPSGGLI